MRFLMSPQTRCWWIPLIVARHAALSSGPKAVVGNRVYVGPLGNAVGFVWRCLGKPTEEC